MPSFAHLTVGQELPPLVKTPSREDLVKYAAGSGDFNPLHFDPDFPQARDIGDNIVHGRLKYAALGQLVSDWLGDDGWIRRISADYLAMDLRGEPFTCRGRVAALHAPAVELELWTENAAGERTTVGSAEIRLHG